MGKIDYYEILQVSPDASREVIDAAYKCLAKKYHPDAGGNEEMMKMLNQAYTVLKDPAMRKQYDVSRAFQASSRQKACGVDLCKPSSEKDAQNEAGAGSQNAGSKPTSRRRVNCVVAAVFIFVFAFAFKWSTWYLKNEQPAEFPRGQTAPNENGAPKVVAVEPVASTVKAVSTLEYFPLDTVHDLTLRTKNSLYQHELTSLQQFLGRQIIEDREVYVLAEAAVSDGEVGDFRYTLYSMNEDHDIYWVGQAPGPTKLSGRAGLG